MGRRLRELTKLAIAESIGAGNPLAYRERYVLHGLSGFCTDKKGETWTSDARVAEGIHMQPDAYRKARKELMRRGLIERVAGGGQGSHKNTYRLFPSAVRAEESSAASAEEQEMAIKASSANTAASSANTAASSANTAESSAVRADISPSNPDTPKYPFTYVVAASDDASQNAETLIQDLAERKSIETVTA